MPELRDLPSFRKGGESALRINQVSQATPSVASFLHSLTCLQVELRGIGYLEGPLNEVIPRRPVPNPYLTIPRSTTHDEVDG
jgi:hypothetical protein